MTLVARDLTARSSSDDRTRTNAPASRANSVYGAGLKRMFDIVLVVLAAPVWLPVILLGAVMIFATDGRSPLYFQKRIGRDGREFWLWKLRTMVVDADAKLEAYLAANPEARAEWDATQKLKRDPRITAVGRLLRKTSLDELPQLVNVLIGDMSLVGPRPMMVNQAHLYDGESYYRLRPGLTGLWQVSERNDCRFIDRVRFDNTYAATMSLATDLGVLLRTVGVVVRGTGY